MEKLIDLHTHTIYSDGDLTPDELIKKAVDNNIGVISITDHDTCKQYQDEILKNNTIFSGKIIKGSELHAMFQNENIEIAFHPGYLESGESLIDGFRKDFKKFYYSKWRRIEYDTLLKFMKD